MLNSEDAYCEGYHRPASHRKNVFEAPHSNMEEGPASCGGVHKVDVISDEFSLNWTGSAMRTDRKRCIRQVKRKNNLFNSAVLNSEDAYCEGYHRPASHRKSVFEAPHSNMEEGPASCGSVHKVDVIRSPWIARRAPALPA